MNSLRLLWLGDLREIGKVELVRGEREAHIRLEPAGDLLDTSRVINKTMLPNPIAHAERRSHRFLVSCLLGLTMLTASLGRADDQPKLPPPAQRSDVTYAADVRPLLERSCFKCHGEEKQKGKLRLDSLKSALKGADGKAVIRPGKSAESELVKSVAHTTPEEDHWMPPPGKAQPLTPEEIGLVRAWIDQGAR